MALLLKLLICLLFVACVFSEETTPPTTSAATAAATTTGETFSPSASDKTTGEVSNTTVGGVTNSTDSGGEETSETLTTVATTTKKPGPCDSSPCNGGSTCEERANDTYVCLCPSGEYYNASACVPANVVPGDLTYTEMNYVDAMADKKSTDFKKAADKIVEALKKVFGETTYMYLDSTVIKLSPAVTLTRSTGLNAFVDIIFDQKSKVTPNDVKKEIQTNGSNQGLGEFAACDKDCDKNTTQCKETETRVYVCECKDAYVKTEFSERMCVACPSGKKASGDKCVACDFGFSGFNCKERWQMDLVIIGSVLGALLLIAIILLPVVAVTSKKKSKKDKSTDYAKPSPNYAPAKIPQVSNGVPAPRPAPVQSSAAAGLAGFGSKGVPRIPRATTNESWDRSTNLEMVPSNSHQNLIPAGRNSRRFDDHDDMNSNPYSRPVRTQNNPYAMGRPQVNPYTSGQGQRNPYYSHADGKRY